MTRILLEFPSYNLTGFQIDEQLQMELREKSALSVTTREEKQILGRNVPQDDDINPWQFNKVTPCPFTDFLH